MDDKFNDYKLQHNPLKEAAFPLDISLLWIDTQIAFRHLFPVFSSRQASPLTDIASPTPDPAIDADVQLMLRVRDDDAEAYQQLLLAYQPRIQRFIRQMVDSQSLAEDLVQDVFLRIWRARKSYQPTAKFQTWIFLIANNLARNAVRDRSKRHEHQLRPPEGDSHAGISLEELAVASTGAIPVRRLDKTERAEMVQAAIQALNDRQRTALLLSKFENLSYQEIADMMSMSVQAVKSLLRRARVNLKILLQPYMDAGQLPCNSPATSDPLDDQQDA